MQHCPNCRAELEPAGRCPACGAIVFTPSTPATLTLQGHIPTVITGQEDAATGDIVLKVDAPKMRSEARTTREGRVSLTVTGAEEIGEKGEPRAIKTFCEKLGQDGLVVSTVPGVNADGEDDILLYAGRRYPIQVTMAIGAPEFWSNARVASAMTHVQVQGAVSWIRERIEAKANKVGLNTVLLLDACHAVPVTSSEVISTYLHTYGSPAREFGFSSVYVVGPAAMYCCRLGEGTP